MTTPGESRQPQLPAWERGTPGILCTTAPRAIPVSTAVRAGDRRLVLALARSRTTLAQLRDDPRAAFCLLGESMAFTAYGEAAVVRDRLASRPHVAGVELSVESVQDHLADGRTEMLAGARWRWTEAEAADDERAIVAELEELAGR
jgi:hypothetical protein